MIPSSKCMEVKCPRCGWITPVRLDAADIQISHDKMIVEYVDELRALNGELCAEVNAKDKRIRDFETSINDVAEKWAIAQSSYQDSARRNKFLEVLVRDMWDFGESSNYPYTPLESVRWAQMREEYRERIAALGIEVDG